MMIIFTLLYRMQKELKNNESHESKEKLWQVEERLIKLKSDNLHNVVKDEIEKRQGGSSRGTTLTRFICHENNSLTCGTCPRG